MDPLQGVVCEGHPKGFNAVLFVLEPHVGEAWTEEVLDVVGRAVEVLTPGRLLLLGQHHSLLTQGHGGQGGPLRTTQVHVILGIEDKK